MSAEQDWAQEVRDYTQGLIESAVRDGLRDLLASQPGSVARRTAEDVMRDAMRVGDEILAKHFEESPE